MRLFVLSLAAVLYSCGPRNSLPPVPTPAQFIHDRPYAISGPASTTPAPLVVVLHGYGGSGQEIADDLGMTELLGHEAFWLAKPDGTVGLNGGQFWNATTIGLPPYDWQYLSAVIDDAISKHPIDPKRVYVVGYSVGAFMAHRLACNLAPKVAAIASVAGAVTTVPADCPSAEPVTVLEIHGDADQVITYDGSPFVGDPPRQTSVSAHNTVDTWARNNHCDRSSLAVVGQPMDLDKTIDGPETKAEAYSGCPAGIDVQLWTMHLVDHYVEPQPAFAGIVYAFLATHSKH